MLTTRLPRLCCARHRLVSFIPSTQFRLVSNTTKNPRPSLDPVILSPPIVGRWLLVSSSLVFAVIVVGGVTRLTESGLSITEWRPITGILPPLSQTEWDAEFEKYKATPEFKLLNNSITLPEFKRIFFMEWSHRILGRVIGLAFVGPTIYFVLRKQLTTGLPARLTAMAALIGAQGLLGWYMVKSGLDDALMHEPGAVPRVSQYRLAAHLGAALVLYTGMLGTGIAILRDWRFAHRGTWSGLDAEAWRRTLDNPLVKRFRMQSRLLTALTFVTAMSGAFVAGLDAGLVYNEFPLMGGRVIPPVDELYSRSYARKPDGSDIWRNVFENPTTVQFNHRVLAATTYLSTTWIFAQTLKPSLRALLPRMTRICTAVTFATVNLQAILGISTLIYLVPVPLAAAHQAGSVVLLTSMIAILATLRRPGMAARTWRRILQHQKSNT